MLRPTPKQEAQVRKLLADNVSVYKISKLTGVSRYHIGLIISCRKPKPKPRPGPAPEPNVIISARIFARTPRGAQLRATEGNPADLNLPPDIAEATRRIREEGFDTIEPEHRHHEPWTEEDYQAHAVKGVKAESVEGLETSIIFYLS